MFKIKVLKAYKNKILTNARNAVESATGHPRPCGGDRSCLVATWCSIWERGRVPEGTRMNRLQAGKKVQKQSRGPSDSS